MRQWLVTTRHGVRRRLATGSLQANIKIILMKEYREEPATTTNSRQRLADDG